MSIKYLLLLALVLALAHSEVVVLDDSNYTSYIQENPLVFVKFYAPWCGHCKSMAADYIKLSEIVADKNYKIAEVDATVAPNTSLALGVEGYPTLKFIVNTYAVDYDGPRTSEGIQKWIETFLSVKIASLTESQVKEKIGSEDFLLIQGASAQQLKVFEISNAVDDTVEYYNLANGDYKVTLYLKDSKTVDFTGELNVTSLTKWTRESTLPIIVPLSTKDRVKIAFENEEKLPGFLLFKSKDYTAEAFSTLQSICEENKSHFKCSFVDETHDIFNGVGRFLNQEDKEKSVLAYLEFGLKVGYAFPNPTEPTKESISAFLQDVKAGKIAKLVDAEKDKKDKQIKYVNVLQLTTETFNDTIKNNKYVFIEYYSPTCGHCVKFAPEYQKFASRLKGDESEFVIAAVDVTAQTNITQWISVEGYPTLRFYVNGNEIEYAGARNGEDILAFMKLASQSKLKIAQSVAEVAKPAVAVYGISQDSPLHLLPIVFTQFPIYLISQKSDFKVQILSKQFHQYNGDQSLKGVSAWLEQSTEPIIVNVVAAAASKKLTRALQSQTPLLVFVHREESDENVLQVFQKFCIGKVQYLCGVAKKGDQDYDSFNGWLEDSANQKNRIVYLTTNSFEKYFYDEPLSKLNEEALEQFVKKIKTGSIKPYKKVEVQQTKTEEVKVDTPTEAEVNTEATEAKTEKVEENTQL